ncbi:MAG: GAF domain-containing protein, partial [Bacteroidales bacterium]|nr:GAF domain-containing protein [Bacteroidales bacterium]
MKLKLQSKLLIYILSVTFVVFLLATGYLCYRANNVNTMAISRSLLETQKSAALKIKTSLDCDISALRSLAASMTGTEELDEEQRLRVYRASVSKFLASNPSYENLSISWEMGVINPAWTKSFGRRVYTFERGDGGLRYSVKNVNLDGDDFTSSYYRAKVNGKEQITGIASDDPDNPNVKPVYKSTVQVPVFDAENTFCALVSGDMDVETFHRAVKNAAGYDSFASFLITSSGKFAGISQSGDNSEKSDILRIVSRSFYDIRTKIDSSGFANYPIVDSLGHEFRICGVSFDNDIFESSWMLVTAVPEEIIARQTNSQTFTMVLILIIGIIIIGLFFYHQTSGLSNFLDKSGHMLEKLSQGNIKETDELEPESTVELDLISRSLNNLKEGLDRAVDFAEEIGAGNLNTSFSTLSDKDELGISLLAMRDSLVKAQKETNERQELDRKQNWITEGAAKFGDILREYNNDMYDFSFNIISNLVKYMGANQGGLFVINDDNKDDIFFELAAGYAYDIRKILRKNVKPGVGLVGRCILESESIYISNLPEDYINITSGLGEKSPQYLLIVPFKFNNQIYAVAEIASFTEIEPYKQQFVEEVGNSIASTIATVKINIRTNKLLQELKVQSEELSSQEEEMRQNMEAMKATQEEMTRKVDEWGQTVDSLNQLIMLTEYSSAGKIINVNAKVLEFFKKEKMLVLNEVTPLYDTIYESEKTNSDEFWLQIRLGRQKVVSKTVSVDNVHYNIIETYNPVQN